ncbi:hypothetical protein L915_01324 [Phytophthora nicotianae]|uniref:Uncharacterized protein n=1 Tax=Phytophthora nicotianae TaxID=4792 RepID=W2JS41_PHYNI|nr:hypothetical protein L915_01324 [Phytophthora nicotianae]ETL49166.1 hypothetical protein L916_01301 [Phytophthora nicotianae]
MGEYHYHEGTLPGPKEEVMSPPIINTSHGCAESMLPKGEAQTKISEGTDSVGAHPGSKKECLAPTIISAHSKCVGGMLPKKPKRKNKTSKKLKRE